MTDINLLRWYRDESLVGAFWMLRGSFSIGILLLLGLRHASSHLYEVPILGA